MHRFPLVRHCGGLLLLLTAAACDNPADPSDQITVDVAPAELNVIVGDTAWVRATAVDGDGAPAAQALAWASSNPAVATVDAQGVVWSVGTGTTWVSAAVGDSRDSVRVTVVNPPPAVWKQVITMREGTCGVQTDGRLYCWALGGTEGYVMKAERFSAITLSGTGFCALSNAGAAYCGQVGATVFTAGLQARAPGHTFRQISGAAEFGCGITQAGAALCWSGEGAPAPVPGDPGLASVSIMGGAACGLTANGTAYCWGDNAFGQLGDGTTQARAAAAPVATALRFARLEAGHVHACALTAQGEAFCWGQGGQFQLGISRNARPDCAFGPDNPTGFVTYVCRTPQAVSTNLRFTDIRPSTNQTCALATDGRAYCWGLNFLRSLGVTDAGVSASPGSASCRIGSNHPCTPAPMEVQGGRAFASLGTREAFQHCAIDAQGAAWCWGSVGADGRPASLSFSDEASATVPPVRLREPQRTPNTAS